MMIIIFFRINTAKKKKYNMFMTVCPWNTFAFIEDKTSPIRNVYLISTLKYYECQQNVFFSTVYSLPFSFCKHSTTSQSFFYHKLFDLKGLSKASYHVMLKRLIGVLKALLHFAFVSFLVRTNGLKLTFLCFCGARVRWAYIFFVLVSICLIFRRDTRRLIWCMNFDDRH